MFWSKNSGVNKDLIEFAEQEAKALLKSQTENRVVLERSRDVLLNMLLAGAGGSVALTVTLIKNPSEGWIFWGMVYTSAYLFGLAALLLNGNKKGHFFMPSGNQPDNLYNDAYKHMSIIAFRELYLQATQQVITHNRQNNNDYGAWLDKIRLFATATPLCFGVAYIVERFF